jgi:hypothetical protein
MRRRWAFPCSPLSGRIRIDTAVLSRCALEDFAASFTFIDDGEATAPVVSAPLLRHEAALNAAFDSLTNHIHLLFFIILYRVYKTRKKPTRFHTMFMAKRVGYSLLSRRALLSKLATDVKKKMKEK